VTEIRPPQAQFNWQVLLSAGWLPILTVGEPGTHGAGTAGIHGTGVSTPPAADVAAATCGLLGVVHIPNGITFVIGTLSMIVPAGILPVATRLFGNTVS
jgi:hypothetical protein